MTTAFESVSTAMQSIVKPVAPKGGKHGSAQDVLNTERPHLVTLKNPKLVPGHNTALDEIRNTKVVHNDPQSLFK